MPEDEHLPIPNPPLTVHTSRAEDANPFYNIATGTQRLLPLACRTHPVNHIAEQCCTSPWPEDALPEAE